MAHTSGTKRPHGERMGSGGVGPVVRTGAPSGKSGMSRGMITGGKKMSGGNMSVGKKSTPKGLKIQRMGE